MSARWTTRIAGGGGGGGGGILAGDVTGPLLTNTVVGIQTVPVSAVAPAPGDVLSLVAGVWTPTPMAGGGTLQSSYIGGNTISVMAADGPIDFDNATDVTDVLRVTRTFAGAGIGLDLNMGPGGEAVTGIGLDIDAGAGATGNLLDILNAGAGDAFFLNNTGAGAAFTVQDGGGDVLDVSAAGAFAVTPTAGSSFTADTTGAGAISLDSAAASNFTVGGAAADLTLGARAATITLNEAGDTTLAGGFTATSIIGALNELQGGSAIDHNTLANLTVGDPHTQYLFLAGRAGGQAAFGGTAASQELILRGTTAANLGLLRARSPIQFDDVTPANALQAYSIQDASAQAITAAFIGGGLNFSPTITTTGGTFIWEGLRVATDITPSGAFGFSAFTMFQGLPVLRSGAAGGQNPLAPLVINAGPTVSHGFAGARTTATMAAINWAGLVASTAAGGSMTITNYTGLLNAPKWATSTGTSSISFGTIRAVWCQEPAVGLLQPDAGTETMTAYVGLDFDPMTFGGAATRVAVRSALAAAATNFFLLGTGTAQSEFAGEVRLNNAVNLRFGTSGGASVQLTRSSAGVLRMIGVSGTNNEGLDWNFDAVANNVTVTSTTGAGLRLNTAAVSIGTTSADPAANWQLGLTPGAKTITVAGDFARTLFTASANVTVNAALTTCTAFTINAPGITIGTGSVTDAANVLVQTSPGAGTNRYGLLVTSNPSGGTLNYCARFSGATGVRIDGILEHTGATLGFRGAAPAAVPASYTVTNHTSDKVYDANSTTLDEIADVLGSVILDLINQGLLAGSVT